nr:uncharacterized protein CFP56_45342 [Quercus suber]
MEQEMIDGLQNLGLTKEEEEGIPITTRSKSDLLEECSLSLFGRLLSNKQQNQRALKSTLRSAWKMGSELKIYDVGNNILQFKFSSRYQMEWVESSGLWNFENNLLLLCLWKKGLSTTNMVFTHSPFWVQLWGLPFEHMSEEMGKDVGNNLGRFVEMDKHACQSDQALFMYIRVELSIDKLLRRGGNVVNLDGEKFWVNFKYERLPTFCFLCGKLGHDGKHCLDFPNEQNTSKQYGEWLRVGGAFKGNSGRQRSTHRDRCDEKNENITKGNG